MDMRKRVKCTVVSSKMLEQDESYWKARVMGKGARNVGWGFLISVLLNLAGFLFCWKVVVPLWQEGESFGLLFWAIVNMMVSWSLIDGFIILINSCRNKYTFQEYNLYHLKTQRKWWLIYAASLILAVPIGIPIGYFGGFALMKSYLVTGLVFGLVVLAIVAWVTSSVTQADIDDC